MRPAERVLLYACAFVLGGLLLFDRLGNAESQVGAANRPRDDRSRVPVWEASNGFAELQDPKQVHETERNELPGSASAFVLRDEKGRPRIEFVVDQAGTAKIVLMSEWGEPVVSLTADALGGGRVVVENHGNRAETVVTEQGDMRFTLKSGNDNHAAMVLSVQEDGEMSLQMTSAQSVEAHVGVSKAGTAEIGVANNNSGLEAFLRTDDKGAAEVSVEDAKKQRLGSMALLANGDSGIRLRGGDGKLHAAMQLFADGLAEIGIHTTGTQSGPHMLRLPNGVSIVASRLPNGRPGASLVALPEGASVVEVRSQDGKHHAALRMDADSRADLLLPKSESAKPKPKPKPKPKQKPKTPPQFTLGSSAAETQ